MRESRNCTPRSSASVASTTGGVKSRNGSGERRYSTPSCVRDGCLGPGTRRKRVAEPRSAPGRWPCRRTWAARLAEDLKNQRHSGTSASSCARIRAERAISWGAAVPARGLHEGRTLPRQVVATRVQRDPVNDESPGKASPHQHDALLRRGAVMPLGRADEAGLAALRMAYTGASERGVKCA